MKPRKIDYLIFYLIIAIPLVGGLISPLQIESVIGGLLLPIIPSLILGTITNLIFKKRNL